MIKAWKNFFNALSTLFSAVDHTAKAVENLAEWANESSAEFTDTAKHERSLRKAKAQKQLAKA